MRRKIIPYNSSLVKLAKSLRQSMTYSEVRLWNRLKNFQMMGYDFDRQKPILNYVVDFYCKDLLLAVEVDGITHDNENVFIKDILRDDELNIYGVSIIRLNAMDVVKNINGCLMVIEHFILNYEEKNEVAAHILKRRNKK
ncbi:MAG TPA: endonuclease domain-containing protein [Chitinophagaceae bacterium]|nr:endonuclease domain-containing protein [Chitinophagaceae bacterium]